MEAQRLEQRLSASSGADHHNCRSIRCHGNMVFRLLFLIATGAVTCLLAVGSNFDDRLAVIWQRDSASDRLDGVDGAPPEWELEATCDPGTTVPTPSCHRITSCGADRARCKGHVLVTGGAGFIGSHTVLALLGNGYAVTVLDNLANASPQSMDRVRQIVKKDTAAQLQVVLMDLRDSTGMKRVFRRCGQFDAVIHFAGLKAVAESVLRPLDYYDNNVIGTMNLLQAMEASGVSRIIFSSSATVYGTAPSPLSEQSPTGVGITNPYGQTKYVVEGILKSVKAGADRLLSSPANAAAAAGPAPADPTGDAGVPRRNAGGKGKSTTSQRWNAVLLRYFNPVGASTTGLIGEQPLGVPNNLMPYIAQTAVRKRERLTVYGQDYPTADGSGERDYIHVLDLADGHVAALAHVMKLDGPSIEIYNLGTGKATTVFQLVGAFEKACRCTVPIHNGTRRPGDLASLHANVELAATELGWRATRSVEEMCVDTWRWVKNPANEMGMCTVRRRRASFVAAL